MAARFWNLLCLIWVYNQLIPRSQPPIIKLQSRKNFCYLSSINGESIALGTRNFPPFPSLLFRPSLKRIESTVHAINYSISKISKHGSTALILPGRLFWLDLTIHMDIQCNPGPERLENSQINHLQPSDNSSRNLNNRASNAIKYSRSELRQLRLRQFKIPDKTFHLLKRNGILRTRGVRSGQAFRNRKHNIAISHVQRRPDNRKPGERGVNLHNLCSIKRVKENKQPSKAPGGLEILHLNIRSLKNRARLLELLSVLGLHAPVKQIKLRSRPCPFVNQEIKDLMRSRDLLLKQFIQSRQDTEWINFKHSRDLVKKKLQEAERDHTFEEVTANKNNSGSLWKIINRAIPSEDKQRPAFTKDVAILTNEFNQFFAKVSSNAADAAQRLRAVLRQQQMASENGIDTTSMELCNLRTVSLEEVRRMVASLLMNKSPGPDKISACVLKDCLPVILGPLTDIINCSILTSTFPDNWKEAEVTPILKDGDHEKAANNRPLSLLAVASKVLERIVLNQFSAYLTKNNRLTSHQSGNKKAHDTETLNILLTDKILEAMDNQSALSANS